ncbi:MAG: glutamate-1-semialdehyde 2,1-aminomutase [Proteobacteria bacterium]|nr:glutamate-1-semialdehyde 2,1-aminomutase [Pseudomonadota bacterium]
MDARSSSESPATAPAESSSESLRRRAHAAIPAGCHTYAKGDDQFPQNAPTFIARGQGCHVWDVEGREYIEYSLGLRAVTLGHAYEPVVAAVRRQLEFGTNFNRPAPIEVECAEAFLAMLPRMEMVKFCKDGSAALDAALKLARAHTGRDMVAICGDHPFFSSSDWFIGSTGIPGGIPDWTREHTVKFRYNDLASAQALFDAHPGRLACFVLEPARTEEPRDGFLQALLELCHRNGALLVLDEMITGFRWHNGGAQHVYGVTPDLASFGKALGNGFALSALAGRRDLMERGGLHTSRERVFLLSTTHGAETHALAAGLAVMSTYRSEPVVETLYARGQQLRAGIERVTAELGLQRHVPISGRPCCLFFGTLDADLKPSQPFRTLFLQEMIERGILAPSFVVSYSHSSADIERTIEAAGEALWVYRKALEEGVEKYLRGPPVKPVYRRFT